MASDSCKPAEAELEIFLSGLSKSCAKDSDCTAYYYRPDSCAQPVILAKPGARGAAEQKLIHLQEMIRAACTEEYSKHPACSPASFRASCLGGKCVNTLGEKPTALSSPIPVKYSYFRFECAPWGGGAIRFYFLQGRTGCENIQGTYVTFAIYSDGSNFSAPKTLSFNGRSKQASGNRCDPQGKCNPAISGEITVDTFDENKQGSGRFKLKFEDGSVEEGFFQADRCPSRMLCS